MYKLKTYMKPKLQLRSTDDENVRKIKLDYINTAHSELRSNLISNGAIFPTDNIHSDIIPIFGKILIVFEYMGICIIDTDTDKTRLFTYCKETGKLDIIICHSFKKALSLFYNISIEDVEKMNIETNIIN